MNSSWLSHKNASDGNRIFAPYGEYNELFSSVRAHSAS